MSKTKVKGAPQKSTQDNTLLFIGITILITFLAYYNSLKNGFTNWDDDLYVTDNPFIRALSAESIKNFFSSFRNGNYHPLTWLSLAIDYKIAELKPFQYHLTNLLLHIGNTIIVFFIVKKLFQNIRIAFASALLFGLHTIHVESVVWIAERKDVLYTFFFFLSINSYLNYLNKLHKKHLVLSLLFFILSAFSKGQAVSLALSIIAIDIFKQRNIRSKNIIIEKIPYLLIAFIFGAIAIKAQHSAEAIFDNSSRNFFDRILFASYGFVNYVLKLIYPFKLSAIYPYPPKGKIGIEFWACLLACIALIYFTAKSLSKNKILFFCITFFTVNIFFVLQLIPVGNALMADRYSYIPSLGFFILLAYYFNKLVENKKYKFLVSIGFTIYLGILFTLTINRNKIWESSVTLWTDTTKKYPQAEVAWNNLGSTFNNSNKYAEAIQCYDNALKANPLYADAYSNRGMSKKNAGDYKNAITDLDQSIKLKPINVFAYATKGTTLIYLNDLPAASACFEKALDWDPNSAEALSGRGVVKTKNKDLTGALDDLNRSVMLRPNHPETISNRGIAKAEAGDLQGAINDFNLSLQIKPKQAGPYVNRGMVYLKMQQTQNACTDFQMAYQLGAKSVENYIAHYCNSGQQ